MAATIDVIDAVTWFGMLALDSAFGVKRQLFVQVFDAHCAVASSAPERRCDRPAAGTLGIQVGLEYEALGSDDI